MVDMHMHSTYSDGVQTVKEILKICEEKRLDYISLTDHNTCRQYTDSSIKENIFSGKIIMGAEMNAYLDNGKMIEFLAYNIQKPETINEWSDKFYSYDILKNKFELSKNKILEICNKNKLIYDKSIITKDIPITDFFVVHMYFELIKHEENYSLMNDCWKSFNDFRFKELDNPNSIFYMGKDESPKPNYKDVAKIIHKAGGLVFLAHPYEYSFDDTLGFINKLRKEIQLDGIECFHPSAEEINTINVLIEYAKNNNLYISGGSDSHGSKKPNVYIGVGHGSYSVPNEYIEEWYRNFKSDNVNG